MARDARTPEYVKKMPQFVEAARVLDEASEASKDITAPVVDEQSAAQAAQVLTVVAKAVKLGNKRRLEASEPYRTSTDRINAAFKEKLGPLEAVEERLKEEIKKHNARVRREQEEAQRKHEEEVRAAERRQREAERAAEEAEKGNEAPPSVPEPPPVAPPPPPPPVAPATRHTGTGSVGGRKEWKFEVFDPAMVPDRFKKIDESAIRQAVKDGERSIGGVRIWEDEGIHVR